jgi:6,7-dimethyl-8-ribityllumazine synthase
LIRSIFYLRPAANDSEFQQLQRFFDALGLQRGDSWQARTNRGTQFLAPVAGVEIVAGAGFPAADLVCEVSDANSAYEQVKSGGFTIAEEISDHEFGGRMFVAEPAPGKRVAIYSYLPERHPQPLRVWEGSLEAKGHRFGIVVSRFNSFITERLLQGALDALRRSGARKEDLTIVRVPGAFEIPSAARTLAETGKVDAVICLGCLIRGETSHYEHIATETTRGIGQSAQETGVPHAYGVLTCDNLAQAIDRAGLKAGNKGFEAAVAAIEMANLKKVATARRRSPARAQSGQ